MKKAWLLLVALGCLAAIDGDAQSRREVWVWKDEAGVTHYSDTPVPGAKKVEIVGSQPVTTPAAAPPTPTWSSPPAAAAPVRYTLLEFTAPGADEAFFGPDAAVFVSVRLQPGLAGGDELKIFYDGTPISNGSSLSGLERGEHTLTAVVVDQDDREKIRAERKFTVQQHVVANPRNKGPALRPPPTPK